MKAAVTHEVPDELGQFRGDRIRYPKLVIPHVVRLVEDRQRHPARRTRQRAHLQWHNIAGGNVGKALPCPLARGRLDHLDPVRQRPLYPVAALSPDQAWRLFSVDEEPGGAARSLVRRDGEVERLPPISVYVAQLGETGQPTIRSDQGVAGQAA